MAAFAFGRCHSTLTSGALANNDVELVVEEGEELVSQVVDARKMLSQSSLCGVDPAVNAARTASPECDARPAKRPCRADSGGIDGGDPLPAKDPDARHPHGGIGPLRRKRIAARRGITNARPYHPILGLLDHIAGCARCRLPRNGIGRRIG